MVSGSIDNRICFWTGYTGKQGACIAVPSAADGRGCNNFIQAVRFADRESADTVVVVMSEGEVYVLEQQSQTFQMPNGSRSKKGTPPVSIISIPRKNEFALDGDSAGEEPTFDTKIHPHSVVQIKQKMMLAVGEAGEGYLFQLKFVGEGGRDVRGEEISRQATPITVQMEAPLEFDVNDGVSINHN